MASTPQAAAFALRLGRLMEAKGYRSNRAFGKKIDLDNPERGRRNVLRHRSGKHMPSEAIVRAYAAALDVHPAELDPALADGDEDEEAALQVDLMEQVRGLRRAVTRLERSVKTRVPA